ncbi:AbrB/MazE/SpoVT family DNA-binding domain-containing protein [Nonomuraea guangzhouensis]|uniref:AbrB/MazE/SpoVT family DNA-binding domain-containing protein n=1 Tax=Nonomuraea guangzhouensis TaxID=1291555 RepID=A0ABW4GMP3_9ACTN
MGHDQKDPDSHPTDDDRFPEHGTPLRATYQRRQVTVPAPLRGKYNLGEGDEVEVVDTLRITRSDDTLTRGEPPSAPTAC